MSVIRRRSTLHVWLVASTLFACESRPPDARARAVPTADAGWTRGLADGAGGSLEDAGADDPAFVRTARDVRDLAAALVKKCHLRSAATATIQDYCDDTSNRSQTFLNEAAALAKHPAKPTKGRGATYVEEVRLFAEWIALTIVTKRTTGTLANYQRLARAWNVWQPSDTTPIDPVSVSYGFDAGGHELVWTRCGYGPCILTGEPLSHFGE